MRATFVSVLAGLTLASAQGIDIDAVLAASPVPTADIPIVFVTAKGAATATVSISSYIESVAASSVAAAISADPTNANLDKRAVSTTSCLPQPSGYGYVSSPDTPAQFLADPVFSAAAAAAPVPAGYTKIFENLNASSQAYGYLGYSTLKSYDTATCAAKCTKIKGCMAFNLYFERDPSLNPDSPDCANPPSVTQIKCVFWGGPVTKWNALNKGQFRRQFQVVITGSNGYVNNSISLQAGYDPPMDLGTSAIDAPPDCSNHDTFLGSKLFTSGPFDANLCLVACSAQTVYNVANPPSDGSRPLTCQFFTTYLLYKNNLPVGQYCSLYSKSWPLSYATNKGMTYGKDVYSIGSSYAFVNSTSPGAPYYPCDVASATNIIEKSSYQPFCTTLLGYTAPTSTVTATVTSSSSSSSSASQRRRRGVRGLSGPVLKRADQATPTALATFAPNALTSACSLEVAPLTVPVLTTVTLTVAAGTVTSAASTSTSETSGATQAPVINMPAPGIDVLGGMFGGMIFGR
ncbi:hypothetical protein CAC42_5610 [Sphaceloma murrayae]|uniref:Carbohydrate-binding-like protein n=1 Tax=Sphaceloma murrayae TaxID=2082308 RepID=A0A2K1QYU3_9PEZI|nr:hypothetical protein CAC42_5610 [Sphaceloma murrayae]